MGNCVLCTLKNKKREYFLRSKTSLITQCVALWLWEKFSEKLLLTINTFVLQKLETDNVLLKKDLAFKDSQVKEYETMLASLRENNRQQQVNLNPYFQRNRSRPQPSERCPCCPVRAWPRELCGTAPRSPHVSALAQQALRDSTARCRSLEEQLLSLRLSEGEKECQLKELEYGKRALEQEIQSLRLQVTGSPGLFFTYTDVLTHEK